MSSFHLSTAAPFAHPLYVMLKPAGARCNLACSYCYYLDKASLYGNYPAPILSDELLERFIRQYIDAQTQREVLFVWHGGETMLRPLSFYQKALALQRKHAHGHVIDNCIQTNGTLLSDEWCRFLKDNNWLVGLSLDGTEWMHDAFRHDRGGHGTHERVMGAVERLNHHGVEWNAMAVVNRLNAQYPLQFYHFFKRIECRYIQFTPVVEPVGPLPRFLEPGQEGRTPVLTAESVTPAQWGSFLCGLFDEWVRHDVGEYFIQLFDATLANWVGVEPGVCSMAAGCGNALAMEFNGDVYSCDHFVFPEFRLGNISTQPLTSLAYSERQNDFRRKKGNLPRQCRDCEFQFACHGECPKNRLVATADGGTLNYLCQGYRKFFAHAAPYMDFMAAEWRKDDGVPARVMQAVKQGLFAG